MRATVGARAMESKGSVLGSLCGRPIRIAGKELVQLRQRTRNLDLVQIIKINYLISWYVARERDVFDEHVV